MEQTEERRSGGTYGGEAQRRGAAVEQRIAAAVARRRDWLRRWCKGEIGCNSGAEERLEAL